MPRWSNDEQVSKDIRFTMNLAKKMSCLLTNDGGTSWMFQFAGVKTLKIFGLTDAKKFLDQAFQKVFLFKNMGISQLLITLWKNTRKS